MTSEGDDKIFGMENFGYTCYCNSILQCLYYTQRFRTHVVEYPERTGPRERKLKMPGVKQHGSITSNSSQINGNGVATGSTGNVSPTEEVKGKNTLARRTSNFFGLGRKNTNEEEVVEEENKENKETIIIPNIHDSTSKILVGECSDPSIEARKKSALAKGPILNVDHSLNDYNVKESLFTALKDVFEAMIENEAQRGVVSPSYLIETLKRENELFRSTMHQDAHEFLNFLLNDVIDTINDHLGAKRNGINELFEGVLTNQTKCLTCENLTNRNETFLDLSIDLTNNETLESCLSQFSAKEMLNKSNKFYCDSCHSLQEAEKKMGLKNLPNVLALHLKRFKYSEELQRNVKLFNNIKYPLHFDLFGDIPDENGSFDSKKYELCGVVVHIGGGPQHGHYVALVKTQYGWLLFDDETVEKIDESFVLKFVGDGKDLATAYILFYQTVTSSSSSSPPVDKTETDVDIKEENGEKEEPPQFTFRPSFNKIEDTNVAPDAKPPLHENLSNPALTKLKTKNSPAIPWLKTKQSSGNVLTTEYNQQEPSPTSSSSTSGFWKRDKKSDSEKEKKKNRMSMSFNFMKS